MKKELTAEALYKIESRYCEGITSSQIIDLLSQYGMKISEPTFRKYIQLGLLPRSRRVGVKGKHKGSYGVYPAETVRRIRKIRKMMNKDNTLEDIQKKFVKFENKTDDLESAILAILMRYEKEIKKKQFNLINKEKIKNELQDINQEAHVLIKRFEKLQEKIEKGSAKS